MKDKYRAKFVSKNRSSPSNNLIQKKLMEASFPLFTEIQNSRLILQIW